MQLSWFWTNQKRCVDWPLFGGTFILNLDHALKWCNKAILEMSRNSQFHCQVERHLSSIYASVSPSSRNGPTKRQRKTLTIVEIERTTFVFDHHYSTDWATRPDARKLWVSRMWSRGKRSWTLKHLCLGLKVIANCTNVGRLGTTCHVGCVSCLYSSSQAILKLSQSARGHFVTLTEIGIHLITCNPGHIWLHFTLQFTFIL